MDPQPPTPVQPTAPKTKGTAWRWLLGVILPIPALFVVAILQFIVRFVFNRVTPTTDSGFSSGPGLQPNDTSTATLVAVHPNPVVTIVNIISILVGVAAVLSLMLTPFWAIMFAVKHDKEKRAAMPASALPPQPPAPQPPASMPPQPPQQ